MPRRNCMKDTLYDLRTGVKKGIEKYARRDWPASSSRTQHPKVGIVVVSYNTVQLITFLLFSIFRILGREQIARVVVVDNASTDGSVPVLKAMRDGGLIDLILNERQRYHGPALNQGINRLCQIRRGLSPQSEECFDYVWVLDSDVVILRPDAFTNALRFMKENDAASIGQFQYDALKSGYAHISSLLVDPAKVWRRSITPFDESGAPGVNFQLSIQKSGLKVLDYPFRSENYLLHLGRGTLMAIADGKDNANKYSKWASEHKSHHYHGNRRGPQIMEDFARIFQEEVGPLTGENLVKACLKEGKTQIQLDRNDLA